jgi:undecaprenyl diphosphate synthase
MGQLPKHIAVIMDGNGRWAKKRFMPRVAGHKSGVEAAKKLIQACSKKSIEILTLFAFSSENWQRPEQEVSELMKLFFNALSREMKKLHENDIKIRFIGNIKGFNPALQEKIQEAEQLTQNNQGLVLLIAANYGGMWDITQATRHLAEKVKADELQPGDIDTQALSQHLVTAAYPNPDLLIRTSGERRLSNFLLWQLAYSELYFTETLWPDFDGAALQAALDFYASRDRRFGCVSASSNY